MTYEDSSHRTVEIDINQMSIRINGVIQWACPGCGMLKPCNSFDPEKHICNSCSEFLESKSETLNIK